MADIAATGTTYYKVIARLWLEGEDKTCKNDTFLALDDSWALSLKLRLGKDVDNVTALTMETA